MIQNSEKILFKQLDDLFSNINESNENNIFKTIKNRIKKFIENNLNYIIDKLPILIDYINNTAISLNYKKDLLYFIVSTLFMLGVNINSTKAIFKEKGVDNQIVWTDFQNNNQVVDLDISQLTKNFELGKYDIEFVNDFYDIIKKQLSPNVKVLNGVMCVTISDDPQNPNNKNYAIDDTPEDKAIGGTLLEKRTNNVKQQLNTLKELLRKDGIFLNITLNSNIESDKKIYFKSLIVDKTSDNNTLNLGDIIYSGDDNDNNDSYTSNNIIKPSGGAFKDISKLSRNYQFVELLKLGGIETERFNGDKGIDDYSKWIIDTRKHIKSFLTRLQNNLPEYPISFDKTVKAYTPIKGSQAGVSNIDQQFSYVEEKHILGYKSFLLEKYNEDSPILIKWNKILGLNFPNLTLEQAIKFDNNVETLLHFLEQMYGNSILNLKIIEN